MAFRNRNHLMKHHISFSLPLSRVRASLVKSNILKTLIPCKGSPMPMAEILTQFRPEISAKAATTGLYGQLEKMEDWRKQS